MVDEYKIKADKDRVIGEVSPLIYGHFIEHIGRCIYGGIYEEGSPLSDERGFRKDVLEAVRRLSPTVLRWPGGCFADGYHWKDGIGPRDERPVKFDLHWGGWGKEEETNRFGTDEFIEYCRAVSAEPYFTVNVGSGTAEEAAQWVEYCNREGNTLYAKKRAKNGHPEPHNVVFWGIGNEIDVLNHPGEIGCMAADDYARTFLEYSKLMRRLDPRIKLFAVGSNASISQWDFEVLMRAGMAIDYVSIHGYYGSENYYEMVACPVYAEKRFRLLDSVIDLAMKALGKKERIGISFDEWNALYLPYERRTHHHPYLLKDGIFAAGIFNVMHRLCNSVKVANISMLVNSLGEICTTPEAMMLTPIYYACELYANNSGKIALDTFVKSATYDTHEQGGRRGMGPWKGVPYLDASVTLSPTKDQGEEMMYIAAVNRHKDDEIKCRISLGGFSPKKEAKVLELNGPSWDAQNRVGAKEEVKIEESFISNVATEFDYVFPAHSATVLVIRL